ncbi:hypothetical protein CF319_g154 [Tilletia indica]|nr:hypothetical protein CF319_g154 [Tilletia indica]
MSESSATPAMNAVIKTEISPVKVPTPSVKVEDRADGPGAVVDDDDDDDIVLVEPVKTEPAASSSSNTTSIPARNGKHSSSSSSVVDKKSAIKVEERDQEQDGYGGSNGEEVSKAETQWLWTAEEFDEWTPSRAVGLDAETERLNRYMGIKFIYQMADRLHLFGHVLHTSAIYFHRFFLRKPMKSKLSDPGTGYDYTEIAVACVFLASKNEEQHRKLGMVIETAIATINNNSSGRNPLGHNTPDNFRRWRDTIIAFEDELFPTLCADLIIAQPLAMYNEACQIFDVCRELIYNGYCMLHDMNRDVYCQLHQGNVQAAAAFLIVHMLAEIELDVYTVPEELLEGDVQRPGDERQIWRSIFFCDTEQVDDCVEAIQKFYMWRTATVQKNAVELHAERIRQQQQSSSSTQAVSSPRRPGTTPAHLPTEHRLQTPAFYPTLHGSAAPTPPLRSNGHHHQRHSAHLPPSSSSSEYTPELGSSAYGEMHPHSHSHSHAGGVPHDGDRSALAGRAGSEARDRWRGGQSARSVMHGSHAADERDRVGNNGGGGAVAGVLLSPEMPQGSSPASASITGDSRHPHASHPQHQPGGGYGEYGNGAPGHHQQQRSQYHHQREEHHQPLSAQTYTLESPVVHAEDDEDEGPNGGGREEGEHIAATHRHDDGLRSAPASTSTTGGWNTAPERLHPLGSSISSAALQGPVSPEMPPADDDDDLDEEGAVDGDV